MFLLPSIIFRMMIPGHLLIPQNLWHCLEASQMYALTICYNDFVLRDAQVANVVRLVGNILVDDRGRDGERKRKQFRICYMNKERRKKISEREILRLTRKRVYRFQGCKSGKKIEFFRIQNFENFCRNTKFQIHRKIIISTIF